MKEIQSLQHPLIKHLCKLMTDAKLRKAEQSVLLEGKNCIEDVCKNQRLKRLLVTKSSLIPKHAKVDEIILISPEVLKKISSVESPEGIIAEIEMPKFQLLTNAKKIVALDRIQDPGNLGTILRSAKAFGWDGAFFLPGTVDPFNDKALRAAKGATFSLPLATGTWKDLVALKLPIVIADLSGKSPEETKDHNMILVLGNEAQGVSPPQNVDFDRVTLSMTSSIESLNVAVAGSILMYLFKE